MRPAAHGLGPADRLRLGALGLTARKGRAALSALGVAIGITAMVAVLGLSESSRADLNAQLDALGTNLLVVQPGQDMMGDDATLPESSVEMIARVPTVESAAATYAVDATVRKSDLVPDAQTSGIVVAAAGLGLDTAVSAELREGRWLDAATGDYPAVVLGATAARRLAVGSLDEGVRVWLTAGTGPVVRGDRGARARRPGPRARRDRPDRRAGRRAALRRRRRAAADHRLHPRRPRPGRPRPGPCSAGPPTRRRRPRSSVSRPSDALEAQATADESLTTLTLGLGAVALLVGAVGIANVMVISVLERRREIGVRRALGATRAGIGSQFLTESVLLSLLGGLIGGVLGVAVTTAFAVHQDWGVVLPWQPVLAGLGCSLLVGTVVGMYPALRAASVPPTEALRAI